jgi:hypothetical protein
MGGEPMTDERASIVEFMLTMGLGVSREYAERRADAFLASRRAREDKRDRLIERYQRCAARIWEMFPADPLPNDDPAQGYIQRLESLLDRGLLAARQPPGDAAPHATPYEETRPSPKPPTGEVRCCECNGTADEPRGLCGGALHPKRP